MTGFVHSEIAMLKNIISDVNLLVFLILLNNGPCKEWRKCYILQYIIIRDPAVADISNYKFLVSPSVSLRVAG